MRFFVKIEVEIIARMNSNSCYTLNFMTPKPLRKDEMPSLTIDGKRAIIAKARSVLGEKKTYTVFGYP